MAAPLRRKGEFKLRALVAEIRELHAACQTVPGRAVPGDSVEFDHIDGVLIALDHALVSVRTLDKEVFEASDKHAYRALRDQAGQVVRGLTAPRNAAVHSAEVIDPDLPRAVGPIDGRFIVYPRWKQRPDVPPDAFAGSAPGVLAAYDAAVATRYLHDTLFDALRFFDACDRSLLVLDSEGQIEGLPLPPLPVPGYHRIHPDWPAHEDVEERIRELARATPPSGLHRLVDGTVRSSTGTLCLCGYTKHGGGSGTAFTETADQVAADIGLGYRYEVTGRAGAATLVELKDGQLIVEGVPAVETLGEVADPSTWRTWADLAASDADYYRRQRKA